MSVVLFIGFDVYDHLVGSFGVITRCDHLAAVLMCIQTNRSESKQIQVNQNESLPGQRDGKDAHDAHNALYENGNPFRCLIDTVVVSCVYTLNRMMRFASFS